MIVTSLDVQGAFPHALHRLLTDVRDAMSLRFIPFMTGFIQTQLHAVLTAAGRTPWTGTDSRGPAGWRRGPLLLPPCHLPASIRAGTGIPRIRPIPATVPPHEVCRRQPRDHGNLPLRPHEHRTINSHRPSSPHSSAHHNIPGRPPHPRAHLQVGWTSRCRDPRPPHRERRTCTPG